MHQSHHASAICDKARGKDRVFMELLNGNTIDPSFVVTLC